MMAFISIKRSSTAHYLKKTLISAGALAGIVIGVLLAVSITVILVILFLRR